jgi:hypothetical protein
MGRSCGPSHCRCGAAGGWMKLVDDDLSWRKLTVGKSVQPKSLVVGLGSKTVLCVQEGVAGVVANLDDDEGLRWWWLTASTGRATSVTKAGAKQRWHWGGKEMGEVVFDLPTREDNLADPCGAAIGRLRAGPAKWWVARSRPGMSAGCSTIGLNRLVLYHWAWPKSWLSFFSKYSNHLQTL